MHSTSEPEKAYRLTPAFCALIGMASAVNLGFMSWALVALSSGQSADVVFAAAVSVLMSIVLYTLIFKRPAVIEVFEEEIQFRYILGKRRRFLWSDLTALGHHWWDFGSNEIIWTFGDQALKTTRQYTGFFQLVGIVHDRNPDASVDV